MTAYSAEKERGVDRIAHQVTVTLVDGRGLWRERLHARGSLEDPIAEAERKSKFIDCLNWAGTADGGLYTALASLGRAHSVENALRQFQRDGGNVER